MAEESSVSVPSTSAEVEEKGKGVEEDLDELNPSSSVDYSHITLNSFPEGELTLEQKFLLARSVGEECIQEEELRNLLAKKPNPICYDGFEPSGRMHIAQGALKSVLVNKLTRVGCTFVFWVADWFALLNNKMGGDLKKIQTVGRYMIEVWKACGMDMTNVKFLWSSEEINAKPNEYWMRVMDIARKFKLPRIKRCSKIMGREDSDELFASQIFYPCMQCADIFFLKADICQLGLDQRKVNMLAREYCTEIKQKFKPIILSHHMIMGLLEGQAKMSKSDPDSAIFMEDTEADVNRKVKRAFCPPMIVKDNPCLDYFKHIIFAKFSEVQITRSAENGGDKTFATYAEMEADFVSGALHPGDLKAALSKYLNAIIEPVRQHFANDPEAKKLLAQVKKFNVTK